MSRDSGGYLMVGRNTRVHRIVVEQAIGRKLLPGEVVHHINGDKTDNRVENLQVITQREHVHLHFSRVMTDGEVERQLLLGWSYTDFQARGISTQRVRRIRLEMEARGLGHRLRQIGDNRSKSRWGRSLKLVDEAV